MESGHVLVAGGGSGGHVFPALAVVEQLAERDWKVSWLGRQEGMERRLVEPRGLAYHALPARALVGQSHLDRAVALLSLGVSTLRARRLIRQIGASAVLGTGGFVSAPGVLGASLVRCPAILLEPNVEPGVANRWLSRWARMAAVAASATGEALRCPVRETGVPLRSEFATPTTPVDVRGPLHLLVLGGSQGARQLNTLLPEALAHLARRYPGTRVTHQVGAQRVDEAAAAYEAVDLGDLELTIVPFIEQIHEAIRRAQLVISRAGAITLAEICAIGRAALLLPLSAAGAHQAGNARHLVEAGGAEMLDPQAASPEALGRALARLVSDRQRLVDMGEAARRLARPDAAREVADLIEEVAGEQ